MVRAGEGGFLFDEFKTRNVIAIGWNDTGSLKNVSSADEIKNLVKNAYNYVSGKLISATGQINRFRFDFKVNDYCITYNPPERKYSVGKIVSEYGYDNKLEYKHMRKVEWLGEISRDLLSTSTRNSLGSTLTIFCLYGDTEKEILGLLKGNSPTVKIVDTKEEDVNLDILKNDFAEKAHEFIKDKILQLDWEDMQELVAGLLRAMGYKTNVSSKGPDRGRDIIASPDGLGLEEPRIIVEVKHRNGQMGSDKIRSFLGGLRTGDKGLYVSTGGFAKEAKYEAERSNIPINLIDSDKLVSLIIQYYDSFDSDAKSLIPLRKVYWPA
jgi:restriction system protein